MDNQLLQAAKHALEFIQAIDGYENSRTGNELRQAIEAAEQNAHLTLGSPPVFCVCCGGEVSHPVCTDCLPSPAQVA